MQAETKRALIDAALRSGAISTPGGFRSPDHIHVLRKGQTVVKNNDNVTLLMDMNSAKLQAVSPESPPKNPADATGGWMAWATWTKPNGAAISSFRTTWTVPPPPQTSSGQLLYLFNGLQDPAGQEILQPVLQWGSSGAGGGAYWSVASWHVDSQNHAFCTPAVQVAAGQQLSGVMTLQAAFNDGTFNYACAFDGLPGTTLMALGLKELVNAELTLEAYGVTALTDYPDAPSVAMDAIDVETGGASATLLWAPETTPNPQFGETTTIPSNINPNGQVLLSF